MRSLLGRFHRPFARIAVKQLLLMNNLGDGSTFSLDFTTMGNTLDPRLTFTRGSNATFINSSGLVQYANHNLWYNTAFDGISGTSPTLTNVGWSYAFSAANSSATFNGDGTVTISATTSRRALQRISGFVGSGRRMIVSVDILTSGDTGLVPTQILRDGSLLNSAYFIDGSPYVSGNVIGPCTLSYVCDAPTPGTFTPYFGVGTSGNSTGTVTFANPRMGLFGGVAPLPYYANTSSGASPSERHDARFDYDPTTIGSPRGLLIEGSAVNLLSYSENFSVNTVGNWTGQTEINTTGTPAWTGFTAPDQQPTAHKIIPNTNNVQHYLEHAATAITSGQTYTVSLFVKPDGYNFVGIALTGSQARATYQLVAPYTTTTYVGSEVPTITPYQNGWFRITLRWTASTTSSALRIYVQNAQQDPVTTFAGNNSGGIQAWGAQLETGSGASSYIPTGASTGNRDADSCVMTGTNFSSWFVTTGTFVVEHLLTNAFSGSIQRVQVGLGKYSAGNGSWSYFVTSSTLPGTAIWGSGGTGYQEGTSAVSSRVPVRSGMTIDWSGASRSNVRFANGTVGGTTTTTGTISVDQMVVGANATGTTANRDFQNGHIRSIKFWPYVLPNSQLQALTT